MKKSVLALAAAAMLAAALPSAAQARCHGCGVAAGVIGGLAAGAIIGGAIAGRRPMPNRPRRRRRRAYYYEDDDDGPICHVEHRRVWVEGWGWRHRRVEVCD